MVQTAAFAQRNIRQLFGNELNALAVFFVAGFLQQREQQDAGLDVVQITVLVVVFDAAILGEYGIDPVFHIREIGFIAAELVSLVYAGEEHTLMVVKMPFRRKISGSVTAHHGIAGTLRIGERSAGTHRRICGFCQHDWFFLLNLKAPLGRAALRLFLHCNGRPKKCKLQKLWLVS